ncbi:unnamed protein product, partial [Discosporangium mesarthrocarpum]
MISTLRRLGITLRKRTKTGKGKVKRAKSQPAQQGGDVQTTGMSIVLANAALETIPVDGLSNADGWNRFCSNDQKVFLRVTLPGNHKGPGAVVDCPVAFNPPEVMSIECHIKDPMAGGYYSILPVVETEMADGVEWEWVLLKGIGKGGVGGRAEGRAGGGGEADESPDSSIVGEGAIGG